MIDEVEALRRNVEQFKFQNGEEADAVAKWGADIDDETDKTDDVIAKLADAMDEVRSNHAIRDREKQHAQKEKERQDQLLFEKRQFELKLEYI